MVRRGTVYIAARLLWRTWRIGSEFCAPCFCHQVIPQWFCKVIGDPSRMGELLVSSLFGHAVWMSLVYSRLGGTLSPLLAEKR